MPTALSACPMCNCTLLFTIVDQTVHELVFDDDGNLVKCDTGPPTAFVSCGNCGYEEDIPLQ